MVMNTQRDCINAMGHRWVCAGRRCLSLTIAVFVALALLNGPCILTSIAQSPAPQECVFQPSFKLREGQPWEAGKAFPVYIPGAGTVLITALHLFEGVDGPDGRMAAADVPAQLEVHISDLASGNEVGHVGRSIVRVPKLEDIDKSTDVVAFELSGTAGTLLTLMPGPCREGIRCMLLSASTVNNTVTIGAFPGTVVFSGSKYLSFKLDQNIHLPGTSGSPIVDASGQVIAMLCSHDQNGVIYCNPGYQILRHVQAALGLTMAADPLDGTQPQPAAQRPAGLVPVTAPPPQRPVLSAPVRTTTVEPTAAAAPERAPEALAASIRVLSIFDDTVTLDVAGTSVKLKVGEEHKGVTLKSISGNTIKLLERGVEYSKTMY